jgi:hypothetical protein
MAVRADSRLARAGASGEESATGRSWAARRSRSVIVPTRSPSRARTSSLVLLASHFRLRNSLDTAAVAVSAGMQAQA